METAPVAMGDSASPCQISINFDHRCRELFRGEQNSRFSAPYDSREASQPSPFRPTFSGHSFRSFVAQQTTCSRCLGRNSRLRVPDAVCMGVEYMETRKSM